MKVVIFEDGNADNFYPLGSTRPLWDLRLGIFTFAERIEAAVNRYFPEEKHEFYYYTRRELADVYRQRYPHRTINKESLFSEDTDLLMINAVTIPGIELTDLNENSVLIRDNAPLAAMINTRFLGDSCPVWQRVEVSQADRYDMDTHLERHGRTVHHCEYIWDIVDINGAVLSEDVEYLRREDFYGDLADVTLKGERSQLYLEDGVTIEAPVVIDVTDGPVVIRKGAHIEAFSRIEGPSFIGAHSRILGARIRGGTTIGDMCRVGGEVEASIFQGFSNKYHDGFIGHAYVGEWVNLGALTSNSDLKNDYSPVKVKLPSGEVSSGKLKVGSFIGDYVKTSIGTLLNSGTVVGPGAMLVHDGSMTPGNIPPFHWFTRSKVDGREWWERFIKSANEAMGRRDRYLTPEQREMLKSIYDREITGK